jgi:uncharacterized protein with HEPN domain
MSKRSNKELVIDILESIQKVHRYVEGMNYKTFIQDEKTIDAVVRNFEVIGEAANRIDNDVKDKFPNVEWRRIIGLRNRIVHEYFGIDLEIIWQIIEEKLVDFQTQMEYIRNALEEE